MLLDAELTLALTQQLMFMNPEPHLLAPKKTSSELTLSAI